MQRLYFQAHQVGPDGIGEMAIYGVTWDNSKATGKPEYYVTPYLVPSMYGYVGFQYVQVIV